MGLHIAFTWVSRVLTFSQSRPLVMVQNGHKECDLVVRTSQQFVLSDWHTFCCVLSTTVTTNIVTSSFSIEVDMQEVWESKEKILNIITRYIDPPKHVHHWTQGDIFYTSAWMCAYNPKYNYIHLFQLGPPMWSLHLYGTVGKGREQWGNITITTSTPCCPLYNSCFGHAPIMVRSTCRYYCELWRMYSRLNASKPSPNHPNPYPWIVW